MEAGGGNGTGEGGVVRGYIDGCFDIMHSGHYNAIRQAKAICDVLVVGVHSDTEIQENKSVPVMRQAERYALLEHIKWIDEIVHDVPYSPQLATLERARADFCIHGDDMPVNAQGVCAYDEMREAGKLRIIKRTEGVSTTDLIGRLLTLSRHQHNKPQSCTPHGVKVHVDDAVEHCAVVAQASLASSSLLSSPDDIHGALDTVDKLARHFSLDTALVEQLKAQIVASAGEGVATALEPNAKRQKTTASLENMRTQVPVQLLASTRRITEFSSGKAPKEGDKIVYVSGSFDMFHVGHAEFLRDARSLGTFLFVGIHDDLTVSGAKGSNYPVMTLNERVLNVCACKWVDEVIIGAPKGVTEDLIKTWNIHVVAKGVQHKVDGKSRSANGAYKVPQDLGILREVPSKWPELCHETVVQRIIEDRETFLKRNRDRARREDVYYASKCQANSPIEF
mmetsp:Transcript_20989/g.53035  ORF Transcript_20989/g.53035 Transcript_20989/m.53035 type:complete len:451 (+) Transcript_20989:182-1534(+)